MNYCHNCVHAIRSANHRMKCSLGHRIRWTGAGDGLSLEYGYLPVKPCGSQFADRNNAPIQREEDRRAA